MSQPTTAVRTPRETEDILGQMFVAFGQGAGQIRVQRSAIATLRARYQGPIQSAPTRWEDLAPNILSFLSQIGRLSALLATQDGRTAISATDVTAARRLVEHRVHHTMDHQGGWQAGMICPAVPGEPVPINTPAPSEPADLQAPAETDRPEADVARLH